MIDNSKAFLLLFGTPSLLFQMFLYSNDNIFYAGIFFIYVAVFFSLSFHLKLTKWRRFTIIESFGKQKKNEKLDCPHEGHNLFDWFSFKTVTSDGMIVGQFPREISRIANFFLDLRAVMQVELTSKHYRCSLLVNGGTEIACLVRVRIPATLKNTKLAEKYLELVRERYTEPNNDKILGCFVTNIGIDMEKKIPAAVREKDQRKEEKFLKRNRLT